MPVRSFEVDTRALEKALERVRKIEPKLKNNLTRDMRNLAKEVIPEVEAGIPSRPPLSGLAPRWGSPKSSVRTYPKARPGRAIAVINVTGQSSPMAKYLAMSETAGSRSPGITPQGKAFVSNLQKRFTLAGRGGRFVWRAWLGARGELREKTVDTINGYIKQFNRLGRF